MKSELQRIQNNKGMTLVEVIVAITILLVISSAFLKSFSLAARINKDSKFEQDALVVAEGLMESFKAYDIEEIQDQFSSATSNASFKLYKLGADATTTKYVDTDYSKYAMRNIKGAGGPYNVDITFTPSTSSNPYVAVASNMDTVDTMDGSTDVVFKQIATEQDEIFKDVYEKLRACEDVDTTDVNFPSNANSIDKSKLSLNYHRLFVYIYADKVEVASHYNYSINAYPYKTTGGANRTLSGDYDLVLDSSTTGYDSYKQGTSGFEDVYVYYYPVYNYASSSLLACPTRYDIVTLNNLTTENKDVYLVKQKNSTYYSETTLVSAEATYDSTVDNKGNYVTVYHNLNTDLSSEDGARTGRVSFVGNALEDMGKLWETSPSSVPLVYNIQIEISEVERPTKVYTLNGSMNAK